MQRGKEGEQPVDGRIQVKPKEFPERQHIDPDSGRRFRARDAEALFGDGRLDEYPRGNGSGLTGRSWLKKLPSEFYGPS